MDGVEGSWILVSQWRSRSILVFSLVFMLCYVFTFIYGVMIIKEVVVSTSPSVCNVAHPVESITTGVSCLVWLVLDRVDVSYMRFGLNRLG